MADIFSIVGSALDAQNMRMSVIASNLANVDSITPPGGTPYRAHEVVFQAAPLDDAGGGSADDGEIATDGTDAGTTSNLSDGTPTLGVGVVGTVLSNATPAQTYDPGNPYADANVTSRDRTYRKWDRWSISSTRPTATGRPSRSSSRPGASISKCSPVSRWRDDQSSRSQFDCGRIGGGLHHRRNRHDDLRHEW